MEEILWFASAGSMVSRLFSPPCFFFFALPFLGRGRSGKSVVFSFSIPLDVYLVPPLGLYILGGMLGRGGEVFEELVS